jgi:hypothetical protein
MTSPLSTSYLPHTCTDTKFQCPASVCNPRIAVFATGKINSLGHVVT